MLKQSGAPLSRHGGEKRAVASRATSVRCLASSQQPQVPAGQRSVLFTLGAPPQLLLAVGGSRQGAARYPRRAIPTGKPCAPTQA
eukprot:1151985-Pelagomonas_calceolata.AAC.2